MLCVDAGAGRPNALLVVQMAEREMPRVSDCQSAAALTLRLGAGAAAQIAITATNTGMHAPVGGWTVARREGSLI